MEEHWLSVFENEMLRRICGLNRQEVRGGSRLFCVYIL